MNPSPSPRRPRFVPSLEALEGRAVPAVAVTQSGATIFIAGDGAADLVMIADNGGNAAGAITVTGTGLAAPFSSQAVPNGQVIQLQLVTGGGSDTVLYTLTNNLGNSTGGRSLLGSLGSGNDTFRFFAVQDVDINSGRTLQLNVNGGFGEDRISARYHGQMDGTMSLIFNGGIGISRDRLFIEQAFDGGSTGASSAQVNGAAGDDLLGIVLNRLPTDTSLNATGLIFGGPGFDVAVRTADVMAFSVADDFIV